MAACLALVLAFPAQAASRLQLAEDTLTPTEAAASRRLVDDALRRLPPHWLRTLDPRIEVEWRDDLPEHVHGRARGRRLLLDRQLLDDWMARTPGPGNTPASPALAAVIHELAHFHDRSPDVRLSRDPRLLDLAGWQVSAFRFGPRGNHNAFTDRSPDRYELTSPAEFVAVNLEYFLLDPEYACRRPALYRYFAAHFKTAPTAAECAPDLVYMQVPDDTRTSPLLQLDPERVLAVEYLLAEPNERMMSRWGHSMLRLVICAPGRPRGPDCRFDLQYHRVLSFRAFVDDVQISNWRGLTGSYPSRLFVLPLDQVIGEYTRIELRGLQSIPLQFERDEIATLLERASQLHWNYDGRYYFLSNNCAVETFKLLHDGVPRLAGKRLRSITPTGLLRKLARTGVADLSVLDDNDEAVRSGYRFEALDTHYQAMFEVARQSLGLPQDSVQGWLALPAAQRTPWLERADLRTAAALLLLEQAALGRGELLARGELKRRFLGRGKTGAPELGSLRDLLQLEGMFSRPASLLSGQGYGLPQQDERAALIETGNRHAKHWRRQRDNLHDTAKRWLSPSLQDALTVTEANIDLLGRRLRHLHRENGGVQLPIPDTET